MTATNHAMTGALLGFVIGEPLLAIPLAFLSHFVCDALPHFGSNQPNNIWLKSKAFRNLLITDASLCVVLVICLALTRPHHWVLMCICAFIATSPDLASINLYRYGKMNKPWHPSLFSRFAGKIQWFERPVGAAVEIVWAAGAIVLLLTIIRA
jgi:hypothetical protein